MSFEQDLDTGIYRELSRKDHLSRIIKLHNVLHTSQTGCMCVWWVGVRGGGG